MAVVEPSIGFAYVVAGLIGLGNPVLGLKLVYTLLVWS
jgi:hypothetical protein